MTEAKHDPKPHQDSYAIVGELVLISNALDCLLDHRLLTRRKERARTQYIETKGRAMMRTIAAAVFALLIVTAPAHATVINLIDDVKLNFPIRGNLVGAVEFTYAGFPGTKQRPLSCHRQFCRSSYAERLPID